MAEISSADRSAHRPASRKAKAAHADARHAGPTTPPAALLLAMQRSAGNAATTRFIQAKLKVGGAGDPLEREADRVAEQVVAHVSGEASTANVTSSSPGTATVNRKESKGTPTAKISSVAMSVSERSDIPGHVMDFKMNLDLGQKPTGTTYDPQLAGALAHDLYGAKFEWWEEIILDYDFTEADPVAAAEKKKSKTGADYKPWSDIYLVNPTSPTFMSWKSSLGQAATGSLSGAHTTGVTDKPALLVKDHRYTKRVLKFRIIATDPQGFRKEIYCTQVLEVEDGDLVRSIYEDTAGNRVVSGSAPKVDPTTGETSVPEKAWYVPGVPAYLLTEELPQFKEKIRKGKATKFKDTEYDAVLKGLKAKGASSDVGSVAYSLKQMSGGNRSFNVPVMPGGKWVQFATSNGGLFVAHVKGTEADLVFYTDGKTTERKFKDMSGNDHSVQARQFEQIDLHKIWGELDTMNFG